jgi:hypothetical protein
MPDKYKDLIEVIVEAICEREGLKIGQFFKLKNIYGDYVFGKIAFHKEGLGTAFFKTSWNHIIFDILDGAYIVEKI